MDGLVEQLPAEIHIPQDGLEQGFVHPALLYEGPHVAPQEVRLLGHIADGQPAGQAHLPRQRTALAAQRPQYAAFACAVAPRERHAVALSHFKADVLRHGAPVIGHPPIPHGHQHLLGMVQHGQLQLAHPLHIVQQGFLLLHSPLLPVQGVQAALHHFGGFRPGVPAPVLALVAFDGVNADLPRLNAAAPFRCLPG